MAQQIATIEDLSTFKNEILENLSELKSLISESARPSPQKRWVRSGEVREALNLSPGTLQKLRDKNQLPFKKINNVILYDMLAIERLLTNQK